MPIILFILLCISLSGHAQPVANWYFTVSDGSKFAQKNLKNTVLQNPAKESISLLLPEKTYQEIDGFGACFNELGWDALSYLSDTERTLIMNELYGFTGCRFTLGRLPIGANDFSKEWYSHNETDQDFAMRHFSIDQDTVFIIPFVQKALNVNPYLKLWASPWSPPTWMKHNRHYACQSANVNDLTPDKQGKEGSNMFRMEKKYLKAYAVYFRKFIQSYKQHGIDIIAVAPQNEFNSCQVFPSCTWDAVGLGQFVSQYLIPEMDPLKVNVILGTMERENSLIVDTVMRMDVQNKINRVGFQWAGKGAIQEVHRKYPHMKLMQTESECGDGNNSWDFCFYTWSLMQHYFKNGASSYYYWNIALTSDGLSRWGWRQNSLISVDKRTKRFYYNPEFYLMKHFSKFVLPEAKRIEVQGDEQDILAFRNKDNTVVIIMANSDSRLSRQRTIGLHDTYWEVKMPPASIHTIIIKE